MCSLVPALIHLGADGYPVILDIPVPSSVDEDAQQADVDPAARTPFLRSRTVSKLSRKHQKS
jgi:hypothetical protein